MSTATLTDMATRGTHTNRSDSEGKPSPAQIKRLREGAGLTQEAFGELVYKSYRVVQEWESEEGRRRMPRDTWELIQAKLKARELLKRGRIAPQAIKDLGLVLPELS